VSATATAPPIPADYFVTLIVDSGYLVVAPGELLNDKELLGALPANDTIMPDIMNHPMREGGYTYGRLPATKGRDSYVWLSRSRRDFSLCILHDYLVDRARTGEHSIDVFYPPSQVNLWQKHVAERTQAFIRICDTVIGPDVQTSVRIVADPSRDDSSPDGIIHIPTEIRDRKLLDAALAVGLAQLRVPPLHCETVACSKQLDRAIGNYLSCEILDHAYGAEGWEMYCEYADWILARGGYSHPRPIGGVFSWMQSLRVERQPNATDSAAFGAFYTIPSYLHFLRQMVEDSLFFEAISEYATPSNGSPASFQSFVSRLCESDYDWLFKLICRERTGIDWRLTNFDYIRQGTSSRISGKIECDANVGYRCDLIAITLNQDTVRTSVVFTKSSDSTTSGVFEVTVDGELAAIQIDPENILPDVNRRNNRVVYSGGTLHRVDLKPLHPAYRRLAGLSQSH